MADLLAPNRPTRLTILRDLGLLDTAPEQRFDDIVALARELTGAPMAAIAFVDDTREWLKARLGLEATQWLRSEGLGARAIDAGTDGCFVVEDACCDVRLGGDCPVLDGRPVRFYAAVPISSGGACVGVLCVLDVEPRTLFDAPRRALQALARQTEALLDLRGRTLLVARQSLEITELVERVETLRLHGAEMLERVLRAGKLGLWEWDVRAGVCRADERERALLGMPESEAVIDVELWRDRIHADDLALVHQAVGKWRDGDESFAECEHRIRHSEGHWIWVASHTVVVERDAESRPLQVIGTHLDITQRKRTEAALVDSEQRLRTMADNLPAVVCYVDRQERYRFISEEVRRAFGVDRDASLGHTIRAVRGEEMYAVLAPHIAAVWRAEPTRFEYQTQRDGRLRHFRSDYIPDLAADGAVRGFFTITFDISDLKDTERRLELLAREDTLTGLPNRRQFEERLRDALLRVRRSGQSIALMFLDIDHFKRINDAFGHAGGDAVLCEFGRRLQACVRATDMVARLAGDEFVILLDGLEVSTQLVALAEKVVDCIRPPFQFEGERLDVSTSVGVAACTGESVSAADMMARADAALYAAKRQGRNRFALS